jgi:hypothetical protein
LEIVFADVIKRRKVRKASQIRMDPISNDWHNFKKRRRHIEISKGHERIEAMIAEIHL